MSEHNQYSEILEKLVIADLIQSERLYRDHQQWERLRDLYHPDSQIRLGWFIGSGEEYVEASQRMDAGKGGWHLLHVTHPTQVQLRGNRALTQTATQVIRRTRLDGVLVDVTIYCLLCARVEKRDGTWRILTMDVIYEKDTAVPVYASEPFEPSRQDLEREPAAYRFSAYNLRKLGYPVRAEELYCTAEPQRVAQFYREAEDWLSGD